MLKNIGKKLRRRRLEVVAGILLGFVFFSTFGVPDSQTIPEVTDRLGGFYNQYLSDPVSIHKFYDDVFSTMVAFPPNTTKEPFPKGANCKMGLIGVDTDSKFYSKNTLLECLKISPENLERLKYSHSKVKELLPSVFPLGFYKGDGIVIVGGRKFSALALLSIKTLRFRGTTLPVEVFIPPGEEEQEVCDFFETMNAHCISLSRILDEESIAKLKFKGYQFKSLLLLASSFENVLLLDADNNLVANIDQVFNRAPFNITGLVTWPDYWKRVTSPHFYDIAGLQIGKQVRFSVDDKTPVSAYATGEEDLDSDVSFHDRQNTMADGSTESGQLLINKYKNADTLLLSFYYNYYGPSHYYPLLGRGAPGQGDKDTFLAAAQVLGKKYYQVKKYPSTVGYSRGNQFHGVGIVQGDPVEDYRRYSTIPEKKTQEMGFKKINQYVTEKGSYFLHAHFPKLEPYELFESKVLMDGTKHARNYGNLESFGMDFDFELLQFVYIDEIFCKANIQFEYARKKKTTRKQLCDFVNEHIAALKESTKAHGGGI